MGRGGVGGRAVWGVVWCGAVGCGGVGGVGDGGGGGRTGGWCDVCSMKSRDPSLYPTCLPRRAGAPRRRRRGGGRGAARERADVAECVVLRKARRGGGLEGLAEDGVEGLEEVARGADHAGDEAAHDQLHALDGILGCGCAREEEVRVPAGGAVSAPRARVSKA